MIIQQKLFGFQCLLKLFLFILAIGAISWCGYFFYTAIYQTITFQGAILELAPQVGQAALDMEQLKAIQNQLEEKKKGIPTTGPARNPFLTGPAGSPRVSTQPFVPPRQKR